MKRGVLSDTWGEGGAFHDGIAGSPIAEFAAAARGKLSIIGRDLIGEADLYLGYSFGGGFEASLRSLLTGSGASMLLKWR